MCPGREGPRGREGVCGELGNLGAEGLNIFFRAEMSTKLKLTKVSRLVIFFSLTEAPLPDPTPTPANTPKRTRNGPKTDPKRSQTEPNGAQTEPNGAEMDRNQAFRGGTGGGFVGVGGVGGCKGKECHYSRFHPEGGAQQHPSCCGACCRGNNFTPLMFAASEGHYEVSLH